MIASSNWVARSAGQNLPIVPQTAAARASREGRSVSCRDRSDITKLLRLLLSSAASRQANWRGLGPANCVIIALEEYRSWRCYAGPGGAHPDRPPSSARPQQAGK